MLDRSSRRFHRAARTAVTAFAMRLTGLGADSCGGASGLGAGRRLDGQRAAGNRRPAARHRHARRAGVAGRISIIRATPIRPRPRAARLVQGVLGTFDSLNPFIVKGLARPQIRGYVVESLLARGYDEPFTLYGLLAAHGRDRRRAHLRHLHARSRRAVLRRQAGDGRGRDLFLAAAARQGPAELPHLLCQGRQGRGAVASAPCASISPAPTIASCR